MYDPVTGEQSPAYLFVAVLPCSCYTYAEACEDMKTENWLSCHVHAFQYFGGVTRLLIPDNCKTATNANTRYETVLNRSYQELAEYYGTAIVPARVRRPQDKSAAEASVRFTETWIIAALRARKFFSIREVNEAIAEKLEELNNRPSQRMAGTRRSAWLEEEKPYMLPLPAVPFEAAGWSVAKVPNDYLVSDGRNKYSVPYNLIGEKVDIRVTKTAVEVFYHGTLDTYTEVSPSGHGVRLIGFVDDFDYDTNRYYINNRKAGLEVYVPGCTKRFLTITGNVLRDVPVRECAGELKAVLERYMVRPVHAKKKHIAAPGSYLSDESVLSEAAAAKNGAAFTALWNGKDPDGKSPSEGDMSLAMHLAFWCGGDREQMDRLFRESGRMRPKWDRAQSGSTYGEITLDKAIAMTDTFYAPVLVSSAKDDFDPVYGKLTELQPHSNSRYQRQDLGFGRLYADVFKDVARYVPERKCWLVYDGKRWKPDIGSLKAMELCKDLADAMLRYALTI